MASPKLWSYSIEVTTDVVHGWKTNLEECFVPSLNLFINHQCCFVLPAEEAKERVEKVSELTVTELSSKQEKLFSDTARAIKRRDELVKKTQEELFKSEEVEE